MGKVKIEITYCGGWGYGGKCEQLKKQLLAKFKDIEVVGLRTPEVSGLFEVQLVGGALLWSKKQSGKFPTSQADLDKMFDSIAKALAA